MNVHINQLKTFIYIVFLMLSACSFSFESLPSASSLNFDKVIGATLFTSAGAVTNSDTIQMNLFFDEEVRDLDSSMILVSGGTLANLVNSNGDGRTYSFEITPAGPDSVIVVTFPSQTVNINDQGKGKETSSSQLQITIDKIAPTVVISSSLTSPTTEAAIPVTVTFSEPVTGLTSDDFVLSGAAITGLSGSGAVYNLTLTATLSGLITLSLPQSRVADAANNGNFASNNFTITFDNNIPVPNLTSLVSSNTNLASIPVDLSFQSVDVLGLTADDFVLTNATIDGLSGAGSVYSFNLIPSGDGVVSVRLSAGVVQNALGSYNTQSNLLSFNVNTEPLNLSLMGPIPALGNKDTSFVWTVGYDAGASINLLSNQVSISGVGSAGCVATVGTVSSTSRSITVTGCTGNGNFTIALPANTASDIYGNLAPASGNSSPATVDNSEPTLIISSPTPAHGNSTATFQWTVTYTNATTIVLDSSLVEISGTATAGCAVSTASSGPSTQVISVTGCSGNGSLAVRVKANSAQDAVGNQALASAVSEAVDVDNIAPTIAIGNVSPLTGNQAATFNWPISYFGASAVSLAPADITLTGSAADAACTVAVDNPNSDLVSRFVRVTNCPNDGTLGIQIAAETATDLANNKAPSAVSTGLGIATIDSANLTVALNATAAAINNLNSIPVVVTFSDSPVDFDALDLNLVNATISDFAGSAENYTFNLIPSGDGVVSVNLPAGAVNNSIPNPNIASNTLTFTIDRVAPTINVTGPSLAVGNKDKTFVWNLDYLGADSIVLDSGDITLNMVGVSACTYTVSNSGNPRTVSVTNCLGDGTVSFNYAANTASDSAGNQTAAGAGLAATVDNTPPVLSYSMITPLQGKSATNHTWVVTYGVDVAAFSLIPAMVSITTTGSVTSCTSNINSDANSSTITVTGCLGDGTFTVGINNLSASDLAGNFAIAKTSDIVTVDNTVPTLSITGPTPASGNISNSFVWTLTFAGTDSISLAGGHIVPVVTGTVAGCSVAVSPAGNPRTVTISTCSGDGTVRFNVNAGSGADAVGNSVAANSTAVAATIDNTGPALNIAGPTPTTGNNGTSYVWTLNYTGASVVNVPDITLSVPAASSCSSSVTGTGLLSRTVTLTNCTGTGNIGFSVAAGSAEDSYGNVSGAAVATTASVDNEAPTLTLGAPNYIIGNSARSFEWLLTYVGATSITLANGNVTLSGTTAGCSHNVTTENATTRKITITGCSGNGNLSFAIAANTATDAVGNQAAGLSAATVGTVEIDNIGPTLMFSAPNFASGNSARVLSRTATFSGADSSNLTAANVTLGGTATAGCIVSVNGSHPIYGVEVTGCTGNGTMNVTIAAGVAMDTAGNTSNAGTSTDWTVDNIRPTFAVSSPTPDKGGQATAFVWTLTYSAASTVSLDNSLITLSGTNIQGCASSVSGAGLSYTVSVTGCTALTGSVKFAVAADSAVDAAGNYALANNGASITAATILLDIEDPSMASLVFATQWDTRRNGRSSSGTDITIPLVASAAYQFIVSWGDGQQELYYNTGGSISHTYSVAGVKTIKIYGTFPRIRFGDGAARDKLLDVTNWGTNPWTSMNAMFKNVPHFSISAADAPVLTGVTNMAEMFAFATYFDSPIGHWNTGNIQLMNSMFFGAKAFNQPLNGWNTSQVTDMSQIFYDAYRFNQPLNNWDTSNVVSMESMFLYARSFNSALFASTESVTTMNYMFKNASAFNQPVNFNVLNVANFGEMFMGASKFNQPLSWVPKNASIVSGMFENADSFNQDLSAWNLTTHTKVNFDANTYSWQQPRPTGYTKFYNDSYPDQVIPGGTSADEFVTVWKTDNPRRAGGALNLLISIPFYDIDGGYSYSIDWGDGNSTGVLTSAILQSHTYATHGKYVVRITGTKVPPISFEMVGESFKLIKVLQWGTNPWQSLNNMFNECYYVEIDAADVPNLTIATDMAWVFSEAKRFNSNINNWDTSNIVQMEGAFFGASSFNRPLDLWDTSNVINTSEMFRWAYSFNQPIGNWVMSSVVDMRYMFASASSFNQSLSWDTTNVVNFEYMFNEAFVFNSSVNNLVRVAGTNLRGMFMWAHSFNQPLSSWATDNVTNMVSMFEQTYGFNQPLNGSWNVAKVTTMNSMFKYSAYNQELSHWNIVNGSSVLTNVGMMFEGSNFNKNITNWTRVPTTRTNYRLNSFGWVTTASPPGW